MANNLDALRGEILESQKARYDLLKWKLVLVAALGATGLGIGAATKSDGNNGIGHLDYVLCLIPLVCVYVDVLCTHMNLRIMVIASYLRSVPAGRQSWNGYEHFAQRARSMSRGTAATAGKGEISAFALEDWALRWSTIALSVLVVVYASLRYVDEGPRLVVASLAVGCGLVLGVVLPLLWRRSPSLAWIIPAILVLPVTYMTLTNAYPPLAQAVSKLQPLPLFLAAGLFGMLLPGLIDVIYYERCRAIEGLIRTLKTKAGRK